MADKVALEATIIDKSSGGKFESKSNGVNQEMKIHDSIEEDRDFYVGDSVESREFRLRKIAGIISRFPKTMLMFHSRTRFDRKGKMCIMFQ